MKRLTAAVLALLLMLSLCGCGTADAPAKTDGQTVSVSWDELVFDRTMPLRYAQQFTVEYAGESYKRITINNDRVYLLVAEGAAVPEGVPAGVTVLHQPLDQIYLVAAAAMDTSTSWTPSGASPSAAKSSRTGISNVPRTPWTAERWYTPASTPSRIMS